ncbi:site-specific integrase [Massilia sp. TW-1]|uniref:Site-specific integrase n=1 Tax=Telluria antibiotica TaxID=2717319 RepID=A0ABX0PC04_9BURK|nr:site-specific integrase [Telluria antibiotica]NIA54859.1 site-specific integrase [Telluria antibiotica]
MAIRLPSHLHRARSGILHFRIAIPPDLLQHFTVREIYRSLRTASVRDATPTAQTLAQAIKRAFQQLRSRTMSDQKKPLPDPFDASEWGLTMEWRLPDNSTLKLTTNETDTPEQVSAAVSAVMDRIGDSGAASGSGRVGVGALAPKKAIPLFSELIEDYKRDRLAANKWTPKTQDENLAVYKLCIDIIGNLPLNEIGEDHALTYVETLKKLPANMNKMPAYRGKTISEIIALNPPPMATRTINKSLERISSLFKFAISKPKYGLQYNPFSGRSLDESDAQPRLPFTVDELIRLFGAAEHAKRRYRTAYSYWLPLMGLLTGARLNELCQLHLSDFEIVGGIYCINIRDDEEGQRVKNKNARRLVPIHDKLIEAGLVRYVERLRAQGYDRLFPTLELTEDGYGKLPSRWFGRFKERCGIMEKHTKVFHSFRHTFISTLLNNDVPETAIAPIVGHEGMLVTSQVYWNVRDPAKRKPTVERFQPPPEVWQLVPKVEDIEITEGW